ncbi:MAG TPA: cell wall hydrolase [Clostridiales bacterium]|nr:cell wall hydrolase [Clostridiales bacterium]
MFKNKLLVNLLLTLILLVTFSFSTSSKIYASVVSKDLDQEEIDVLNIDDKDQEDLEENNSDDQLDEEKTDEEEVGETKKTEIDEEIDEEIKKATKKASKKKATYSKSDLRLLSALIYAESGGESYQGKLAVANVVLNRVKSPVYSHAKNIKQVIYDKKWAVQFAVIVKNKKTGTSPIDRALQLYDTGKYPGRNNKIEKVAMDQCIKAAKAALEGKNNIGKILCFNSLKCSTTKIKRNYPGYKIIGNQIFYRTK